jgi:co-chaperonin GroES (HSP10)
MAKRALKPSVSPLGDKMVIDILERGSMISNGIIIPDDDFKERGIRPRRCKVLAVGPECLDVRVGDHVLVGHADWTRGLDVPMSDGTVQRLWFTEESRVLMIVD